MASCSVQTARSEKEVMDNGLKLEPYHEQKSTHWPSEGKHILAQFDDDTVVVYQAYKPSIAKFAVENQRFGGDDFSFSRMSWIKTNFLWMMYRCGWASKKNQERVLAIRITRKAFHTILENAYTAEYQKSMGLSTNQIQVRLQWDPDHHPNYSKLNRKAIQLGLKGKILEQYGTDWIVSIKDITDLVKQQRAALDQGGIENLWTPRERIYPVTDKAVIQRIDLSSDYCKGQEKKIKSVDQKRDLSAESADQIQKCDTDLSSGSMDQLHIHNSDLDPSSESVDQLH